MDPRGLDGSEVVDAMEIGESKVAGDRTWVRVESTPEDTTKWQKKEPEGMRMRHRTLNDLLPTSHEFILDIVQCRADQANEKRPYTRNHINGFLVCVYGGAQYKEGTDLWAKGRVGMMPPPDFGRHLDKRRFPNVLRCLKEGPEGYEDDAGPWHPVRFIVRNVKAARTQVVGAMGGKESPIKRRSSGEDFRMECHFGQWGAFAAAAKSAGDARSTAGSSPSIGRLCGKKFGSGGVASPARGCMPCRLAGGRVNCMRAQCGRRRKASGGIGRPKGFACTYSSTPRTPPQCCHRGHHGPRLWVVSVSNIIMRRKQQLFQNLYIYTGWFSHKYQWSNSHFPKERARIIKI
jgi:hypothetical protein